MSVSGVLVFAGSIRTGSLNRKLAAVAAAAAEAAGLEVTHIDLADYELPLYNGDLEKESGLPDNALRLKELFDRHHALLLACPEYNSSITPLFKNTIDWVSRRGPDDEVPLQAFRGKVAGLTAASPGRLGGMRGLVHVRAILGNLGVWVAPSQLALSRAHEAFDDDGRLVEEGTRERLEAVVEELAGMTRSKGPA